MPLLGFDDDGAETGPPPDFEVMKGDVRRTMTFPQVADLLGLAWDETRSKVRCPAHKGGQERTPSLQVHEGWGYCFACNQGFDIFSLTMAAHGVPFVDALEWLYDRREAVGQHSFVERHRGDYKGPFPYDLAIHWHELLGDTGRELLHRERGLTDATIDRWKIGWRPDVAALTVPYWRGKPGWSEIDIIQFRATAETGKKDGGRDRRYWGVTGFNRPSILGAHRVGLDTVIVLFGTFDALLAQQDGLPAVSVNGTTAFLRDEASQARLLAALSKARRRFVVPDRTESEYVPAQMLAKLIGGEVRYFPTVMEGKDYSDWRLHNNYSADDFLREVLMLASPFVGDDPEDNRMMTDMMGSMANGDAERVDTFLAVCQQRFLASSVARALYEKARLDPFEEFSAEQWAQFRADMESVATFPDLEEHVMAMTHRAIANQGRF